MSINVILKGKNESSFQVANKWTKIKARYGHAIVRKGEPSKSLGGCNFRKAKTLCFCRAPDSPTGLRTAGVASVGELTIAQSNPDIIYAATFGFVSTQTGLFKSMDGAATWIALGRSSRKLRLTQLTPTWSTLGLAAVGILDCPEA